MDISSDNVVRCSPDLREKALRVLHENLPNDLKTGLVQAIESTRNQGEDVWGGLFIYQHGDQVCAAWAQLLPGRIATLWPPSVDDPIAKGLLQKIGGFLDQHDVVLTQLLLENPQGNVSDSHRTSVELLTACGYCWLANLQYLLAETPCFPPTPPTLSLRFESDAGEQPQRLAQLLLQTYIGTCDCPAVEGIRPISDVLTSYRSTGRYQKELWFFVQHQGCDVGALLMAPHGEGEVWELVYMGIVPTARGQCFGDQIVQQALWQTSLGGGQRMVLAVDEANGPALTMYHRANLVRWDRRQVYARLKEGRPLSTQQ